MLRRSGKSTSVAYRRIAMESTPGPVTWPNQRFFSSGPEHINGPIALLTSLESAESQSAIRLVRGRRRDLGTPHVSVLYHARRNDRIQERVFCLEEES